VELPVARYLYARGQLSLCRQLGCAVNRIVTKRLLKSALVSAVALLLKTTLLDFDM